MPQEVLPDRMTPLTPSDAIEALYGAYYALTGNAPELEVLRRMVAQTALETANWKSLHNYNFGNVKADASYPVVQYFRCGEVVNGKEVFFDPPHPQCRFRAYRSAVGGASEYINTLQRRPHWWAGLHAGTISDFNAALSTAPKYYTANPQSYLRGLEDRNAQFGPLSLAFILKSMPLVSLQERLDRARLELDSESWESSESHGGLGGDDGKAGRTDESESERNNETED